MQKKDRHGSDFQWLRQHVLEFGLAAVLAECDFHRMYSLYAHAIDISQCPRATARPRRQIGSADVAAASGTGTAAAAATGTAAATASEAEDQGLAVTGPVAAVKRRRRPALMAGGNQAASTVHGLALLRAATDPDVDMAAFLDTAGSTAAPASAAATTAAVFSTHNAALAATADGNPGSPAFPPWP